MAAPRCVAVPSRDHYVLANAHVPTGCIEGGASSIAGGGASLCVDVDNLAAVDIVVRGGQVAALYPAGSARQHTRARQVDLAGKMVLPTFADLHTHIGGPGRHACGAGGGLPERVSLCRHARCCPLDAPHICRKKPQCGLESHTHPHLCLQTRGTPRSAAATPTAA